MPPPRSDHSPDCADLEIGLHRREGEGYAVELRFSRPQDETDYRPSGQARFDVAALLPLTLQPAEYGTTLSAQLFADPEVRDGFHAARARAGVHPLRLRLFIGPSAPELHALRWETLRDPEDGSPLATDENLLFSRYLSSEEWPQVRLRPRSDLRALLAVATPTHLPGGLARIDRDLELWRCRAGLGGIPSPELPPGGVTLEGLIEGLRAGHDLLYLVAHGQLKDGRPWLWLERDDERRLPVAGEELVTRLGELRELPRLMVLASCRSAGAGENEPALLALGPQLAQAGVPAVLAMQGSVSMNTIAAFMPVFFRELQGHGEIDRAVAVARGSVRERHDFWMPVLFMRLKRGRIWAEGEEEGEGPPQATYHAEVHGSGAIAQGPGAQAAGERGVVVGGNVQGNIVTGDHNVIGKGQRERDDEDEEP